MTVQLVGNDISNVNFTSKHRDGLKDRERAAAFVNLNDDQVKLLAYSSANNQRHEKKVKRSMLLSLYALPFVSSISSGILAESKTAGASASLSERLLATSKTAWGWAGALLLLGAYTSVKNKLASKSQSHNDNKSNHPATSLVVDFAAFAGLLFAGSLAAPRIVNKFKALKPELAKSIADRSASINAKIDNGFLNQKVLAKITEKAEAFAKKAPWAASAGKAVIANSVWIVFIASMLNAAHHANQSKKKIENRYVQIKDAQFNTAKHLSNVLGVERDVLAQNQMTLAADLRRAIDGKKPVSDAELAEFEKQKQEVNETKNNTNCPECAE